MDADQELFAIFRAEVDDQIESLCDRMGRAPERWNLDRMFQISHNVKGAARLVGVTAIQEAAHALENLFSAIRDGLELSDEVASTARGGADLLVECFHSIDGGQAPEVTGFRARITSLIAGAEDAPTPGTDTVHDGQAAESTGQAPETTEREASQSPATRSQQTETLRVGADKLESLMGLASVFVSHVFQIEGHTTLAKHLASSLSLSFQKNPHLRMDPDLQQAYSSTRDLLRRLLEHSGESLRVSDELQASVRSLRMVRIEGLKTLLGRSLRDACRSTGRQAVLRISGGETEVDRMVLDQLRDPLVHLIRNAVAHGIETPAERLAAAKPDRGTVEVEARSVGAWVEVTVADDGGGIDQKRLAERVVIDGLITDEELEQHDEEGILDLLFLPGITTADTVTELAGRGVGLDVVRTQMRKLGGEASITSMVGAGTKIVLRVPLTRLTTTGILVRVGRQIFAVPTSDVLRTLHVRREDVSVADGTEAIPVDGHHVRISPLAAILGCAADEAYKKPALIISDGIRQRALLVDEVIGQREYILQPLAWNLEGAYGVSGTTVLDGGDVVLVLDTNALVGAKVSGKSWLDERSVRQYRILVVDDSATSRTLERNILRTAGYEVLTAVDGERALETLSEEDVDLVVSDVEMPRMDGFELTRNIRSRSQIEHLPIILVTSLGSDEHKQQGAESGADAYIVKGAFDQDELLSNIARLL